MARLAAIDETVVTLLEEIQLRRYVENGEREVSRWFPNYTTDVMVLARELGVHELLIEIIRRGAGRRSLVEAAGLLQEHYGRLLKEDAIHRHEMVDAFVQAVTVLNVAFTQACDGDGGHVDDLEQVVGSVISDMGADPEMIAALRELAARYRDHAEDLVDGQLELASLTAEVELMGAGQLPSVVESVTMSLMLVVYARHHRSQPGGLDWSKDAGILSQAAVVTACGLALPAPLLTEIRDHPKAAAAQARSWGQRGPGAREVAQVEMMDTATRKQYIAQRLRDVEVLSSEHEQVAEEIRRRFMYEL